MRRLLALLVLAACVLIPNSARAQSGCPYIAPGAILTAAQWQACFQGKADILSGGNTITFGSQVVSLGGAAAVQGNGTKIQLSTGSPAVNNCAKFDANGNTIDSGSPCGGTFATTIVAGTTQTSGFGTNDILASNSGNLVIDSGVSYLNIDTLTGNQTISGNKTISGSWIFNSPNVTFSGLAGSTCASALALNGSNQLITYACPSFALVVGSTPVTGSSGFALINSAGTLGNVALQNQNTNAPQVCDIIATAATTCNNGGSAANNGTYTVPSGAVWLEGTLVGAGGPGGGGNNIAAGTAGGATCWNTTGAACTTPVYSAGGGSSGQGGASNTGGAGGTVAGSGTCGFAVAGGNGTAGGVSTTAISAVGGIGGSSTLAGAGKGGWNTAVGGAAQTNSGSGGGGGGQTVGTAGGAGGGGGGGATCHFILTSLAASYTYAIGAGQTGVAAGTSGEAGGASAAGHITIVAHFNN
jgi:hypothetical protein